MKVSYFELSPFPYIPVLVLRIIILLDLTSRMQFSFFHLMAWAISCAFIDDFMVKRCCCC